jgi:NAD(P)-dependent dehydrogenase (short-subunit alcohol dehydrogenase family)
MDLGLRGRVALVTGASTGIGRATALALAAEGAKVGISYRTNRQGAEAVAEAIRDRGAEAVAVELALEDGQAARRAVEEIAERLGGIDVLVASAVSWPTQRAPEGQAERLDLEVWHEHLRVNLVGTIATVTAVLPYMRRQGWGRIVLISSGVADEGVPGPGPYGVAKAGLQGLARQLAWDVGRDGILVNVVAPGFTVTERNRELISDDVRERVARQTPTRRLSSPEEVASIVGFLASEANGNISGELVREGSSTGRSGHLIEV